MFFLECLKAPVLQHHSRVKVFTDGKHCWNLHGSTFILYFTLIQEKLSQKTSLLVRTERIWLFGNTLAGDHMYSSHTWGKVHQEVKTLLSEKRKPLSRISIAFSQSTQNFAHFQKKDQLHSLNISLQKMWLREFPKAPVLEHHSRLKVFMGDKHCWNLHGGTFTPIFFH